MEMSWFVMEEKKLRYSKESGSVVVAVAGGCGGGCGSGCSGGCGGGCVSGSCDL